LPKTVSRRELFELLAEIVLPIGPTGVPARARASDWDNSALWYRLLALAQLHHVLPALARPLEASGILRYAPASLGNLLKLQSKANRVRNMALLSQGSAVLRMLTDAEVPVLPLKGLAYQLVDLYGDDPGRRLLADIDVLVPRQAASQAQAVLMANGYQHSAATANPHTDHHLTPLELISRSGAPIEIHFHVITERLVAFLPAQEFFRTAVDVESKGARVPSAACLLDHAIIGGSLQDGQYFWRTVKLRDVHDIRRLWDRLLKNGGTLSDLRAMQDERTRRHFGACLLLAGVDPSALDSLEIPARRHLSRVLARQAIAERPIEAAVYGFWDLFQKQPDQALKRLFFPSSYRRLIEHLRSERT
jgi:hypothetical protein